MKLELRKKLNHVILYLGIPKLLRFVSISPRTVEFRVTENCNSSYVIYYGNFTDKELIDRVREYKV